MGTWTRNFLVPKGNPAALRKTIVHWLERKGFDRVERILPFADDSDDERAAFLVSNAQWSVILYRQAFEEGDRLLSELDSWPAVLETVIADSDVWAYELIENGDLTAAFNSNPRYFGGNDQKLPQNGDPERLCRALGLEGREAEVRRVQSRRSLFADFPCLTFCRLLGAPAGALHFADVEGWNNGRMEVQEVAEWRIEPLYFEKRKQFGEDARPLILHSLAVREFETRPSRGPEIDPELAERIRKQIRLLGLVFKPLQWIFTGLGPLFRWWIKRQSRNSNHRVTGDVLLDALAAMPPEPFTKEGDWLINRRHGFRIRVTGPLPENRHALFRLPHEVLRFSAGGVTVSALAIRPQKLRNSFTLRQGMILVADEPFFAGPHPARHLTLRIVEGQQTRFLEQWFIELEPFVLLFDASSEQQLSSESQSAITAVIQTFELIQTP